jgi:hypothetical protein
VKGIEAEVSWANVLGTALRSARSAIGTADAVTLTGEHDEDET